MKKLCIIITGFAYSGKSTLCQYISESLPEIKVKSLDLCYHLEANELYDKPDIYNSWISANIELNDIVFLETHPPYIPQLQSNINYDVVYLILYLTDYDRWKLNYEQRIKNYNRNKPPVRLGIFDNILTIADACLQSKSYYEGARDINALTCTRTQENFVVAHSVQEAETYLLNYIVNRIEKTEELDKQKLLLNYSKRKDEHNMEVFQYQSFHYDNPVVENIGMSDPDYKWHNILNLDGFDFKNKSVLDIGCNSGEMLRIAGEHGASRLVGIERGPIFFNGALFLQQYFRKQYIKFINSEFMTYNFKESFDYIFAFAVLYCLYDLYSYDEIISKISSMCRYAFVEEVTYTETVTRDMVEKTLKKYFNKVECLGDSVRTNICNKSKWENREKSNTRQVWHCIK